MPINRMFEMVEKKKRECEKNLKSWERLIFECQIVERGSVRVGLRWLK